MNGDGRLREARAGLADGEIMRAAREASRVEGGYRRWPRVREVVELALKRAKAPTTVLVGEDRVTGHNPAAALCASNPYRSRLKSPEGGG